MITRGPALFFLALACRLLWAWWSGQLWGYVGDYTYDDGAYIDMALSFIGRSATIWISHPPAYSAFLAPFLLPGDWGISLARLCQILLGAGLAPLVAAACRRMDLDPREAAIAGLLMAVHPMMIFLNARIMPETLFVLLVVCFFTAWTLGWRRSSPAMACAAGVLGGLASLTRGVMLPFGLFLALTALVNRRQQPRWPILVAVCGLAWALTIAPWTARNWLRFDRFVAISAQGGWNFYEGLTLDLEQVITKRPAAMGAETSALGMTDTFEIGDHFSRKSAAWVKANPGAFIKLLLVKAGRFWRLAPYPPHPFAGRLAMGAFTTVVFVLAFFGLRAGFLARPGAPFLAAWVLYLTAMHSIFASNLRYRMPAEPFLAAAAGVGAVALWRKKTGRRT